MVQRKSIKAGNLSLANPCVMGILNVTPDSFSDGGRFDTLDAARRQASRMVADGAALIDIGGESTRPGADTISVAEELERVIPVIEAVVGECGVPVSVDTSKAPVMREAVAAGAAMINDVLALRGDGALAAAIDLDVPVCLMHMQGQPRTMQHSPAYDDVTRDVVAFLSTRVAACAEAGLRSENLLIDPGFGFGKSHAHNVELLANLRQLQSVGPPILVGWSRKSTLGEITGRPVEQRVAASVAAAVIAVQNGAVIVRAHDVGETVDALKVTAAVMDASK